MMDTTNSVNDPSLFQNTNFNPFNQGENILLNNDSDPDFNLFSDSNLNINTPYLTSDEVKTALDTFQPKDSFSAMHVNIRSLNKNFENLKTLLSNFSHEFSMICLSESWCKDESIKNNSNSGPATRFQYWGGLKKMSPTMVGRRRFFEL